MAQGKVKEMNSRSASDSQWSEGLISAAKGRIQIKIFFAFLYEIVNSNSYTFYI